MAIRYLIVPGADRSLLRSILARVDQALGYPRTHADDEPGVRRNGGPPVYTESAFAVWRRASTGDLAVQVDDEIGVLGGRGVLVGGTCLTIDQHIAAQSWTMVSALPGSGWTRLSARDGGAGSVDSAPIATEDECTPPTLAVYAVLGQSNAGGYADEASLTDVSLLGSLAGVLFVHDLHHVAEGISGSLVSLGNQAFGVELSMARAILSSLAPREYLAILKVSRGSSGLVSGSPALWAPTNAGGPGERVTAFVERWGALTSHVSASYPEGTIVELRGAVWIQGESDAAAGVSQAAYQAALVELKGELFAAATAPLGARWVTTLFHADATFATGSARSAIDAAKTAAAAADSQVRAISGTAGSLFDGTHYSADSLMSLGECLAAELLA